MTTFFLNRILVSLRSFRHRVALKCGVMNHKNLLNKSGLTDTATHCDRGATTTGFFAPIRTYSRLIAPNRTKFLPVFSLRAWFNTYLDRGLTTSQLIKASKTQSKSVKPSQSNFFPLFSSVFPFSIFHFPFPTREVSQ
jgi:hypothetical protein